MQIVNGMGDTVVTVKDFISCMVTMMAPDGQVIYGFNCCVLVTSCLVSFSVTVFIVCNVFVVFLVMSSCGHSYEVGIAYVCYWQTISCLMVIYGL